MISHKADEVIKKLFDLFKNRYQNYFELIRSSDFVFDYVQSLYYKYHKINRKISYIDSPDWILKQKSNNKSHQ